MTNLAETKQDPRNLESLQVYYRGDIVSDYETRRATQASWHAEARVLDDYLEQIGLAPGAKVLDLPIGTGRFLETFQRHGFRVVGRDISEDMVAASRRRAAGLGLVDTDLAVGDGAHMDLADKSVALAVSVRFLVHLELPVVDRILAELARVSSGHVIAHIRLESPGRWNAWKRALDRTVRKLRRASTKKVSNKAATLHRREDVEALFRKHGLRVLRDEITNPTGKGHDSHLFLLRREAGPSGARAPVGDPA